MTRREAMAAVASGVALVAGGLAWAVGPWGLVAVGAVLLVTVLFVVDVRGGDRA